MKFGDFRRNFGQAICVCVNAMLLDGIGNVWMLFVRREFEFSRQQNVISTVT